MKMNSYNYEQSSSSPLTSNQNYNHQLSEEFRSAEFRNTTPDLNPEKPTPEELKIRREAYDSSVDEILSKGLSVTSEAARLKAIAEHDLVVITWDGDTFDSIDPEGLRAAEWLVFEVPHASGDTTTQLPEFVLRGHRCEQAAVADAITSDLEGRSETTHREWGESQVRTFTTETSTFVIAPKDAALLKVLIEEMGLNRHYDIKGAEK